MPSYRLSSKGGTKLPAADWVALEELNSQLLTGLRTILIPARIRITVLDILVCATKKTSGFWIIPKLKEADVLVFWLLWKTKFPAA